jgi:dynein heavy chain 2, cytosolic
VETLQTSIEKDAEEVFKFIRTSLDKLNTNPKSVDEIDKIHQDAMIILNEKETIVKIFEQCEKKNLMIKQITGSAMRLSDLESMWREFDARINAFNDKIEDQKTKLMGEIDSRIKELNQDLEKMFERWQEKKPKERNELTREQALETSDMMKELRQQWAQMNERSQKCYRDCEHFKKPKPEFKYYDKLKDELNEQEEIWGLFDEFNTEIGEFGKEDWITYRKKAFYAFQDFFIAWQEKLKGRGKNIVTRFLMGEIDSFAKAWPLLKLCVGESFEREHWRRLITLLDMPKDVTLDNMKFKHLVDAVQ